MSDKVKAGLDTETMLTVAVVFLLLVVICLVAFLLVLVRHDIPPRIALEKIQNRYAKRPPTALPNFRDAPYRRLTAKPPLHHPTLLNLETSEGTGQACHPDVAFIEQGFGTRRWRYWMVCTPYAYLNFVWENPEIFASHDGIHWTVPEGAKNPLVSRPEGMWDHNSDPDMFFLEGKLWLYYRETRRTSGEPEIRIFLIRSEDGVNWTPRVEVLQERGDTSLLMSPAVVHEGCTFRMWTVEKVKDGFQLVRRDSADGVRWNSPVACKVVGLREERQPWHLDVVQDQDRLSAIFVSAKELGEQRLHYGWSVDGGITWELGPYLIEPAYEFEEGLHYRTTLLKWGSSPHEYQIWYSAGNRRNMFSIAYLRMIRENNRLEPVRA